jgi:hypothetical protein
MMMFFESILRPHLVNVEVAVLADELQIRVAEARREFTSLSGR